MTSHINVSHNLSALQFIVNLITTYMYRPYNVNGGLVTACLKPWSHLTVMNVVERSSFARS